MFRLLLLSLSLVITSSLYSQERRFKASPIDEEQNVKITQLDERVTALENNVVASTAVVDSRSVDPLTEYRASKGTVLMITNDNQQCNSWWNERKASLEQAGWNVDKIEGKFSGVITYPSFRIYSGGQWMSHDGYLSRDDLKRRMGLPVVVVAAVQPAVQPAVQSSRYSTEELRSQIYFLRPNGWNGPIYADVQPRSSAKLHLTGNEHGFSWDQVNGLTQEEALILHDLAPKHGNKIFPVRPATAPLSPQKKEMVELGCPNGQCDKSRATYKRFGWFR